MDTNEFDGLEFGDIGPVIMPAQMIEKNHELARALLTQTGETLSLRRQLHEANKLADDLAALVCHFITALRLIRPQVGNGARAAIDAALAGVETPNGGNDANHS